MSQRFSGRNAIITGGASGIGLAVAKRIVDEGGKVGLWDIDETKMMAAREETGASFIRVVDITHPEDVVAATKESIEALDGVDILVTCAGVLGPFQNIEDLPLEEWHRMININLHGTFLPCRAFVPHFRSRGYGRIVTLGSIAGKEGNPGGTAYTTSKAAVISLTKCLGKELATSGVVVNTVTPGIIDTPMSRQAPPAMLEEIRQKIPMQRLGKVEEAAAMICFMASEECSFTTGAVFDLSGGRANY